MNQSLGQPIGKPLNPANTKQKKRLSEDLTVVLLRGNGSPRSYRFSLRSLHRALTALGFTFAFSLAACAALLGLSLVRGLSPLDPGPAPRVAGTPHTPVVAPIPPAPEKPAEKPAEKLATEPAAPATPAPNGTGLWQQLSGAVNKPSTSAPAGENESELRKEVEGLRKDVARLGAANEGRRELAPGRPGGLLQFFGPGSTLVPEAESGMRLRNPRVIREGSSRQVAVDFELHNVDPQQRQVRGYIVGLAKSPDLLVSYPGAVFAPGQNIVLDYTKGETFAVSRFRQARATFPAAPLEGKKATYQLFLFDTDGRVLANLPVEDTR